MKQETKEKLKKVWHKVKLPFLFVATFGAGVYCGTKLVFDANYDKAFLEGGQLIGSMAKDAVDNDRFELFLETAGEVYGFKEG